MKGNQLFEETWKFDKKTYLVTANQIGMENCKATNKPYSYEAVDYETNR